MIALRYDEVLTISEKVVVRVHDLVTWLSPSLQWSWGREVQLPPTPSSSPDSSPHPQTLSDPGLDFTDVERLQKDLEALSTRRNEYQINNNSSEGTKVVVLSYPRYCRYRALMRRLEGSEPKWLASSAVAALGGFAALPGTRVLFCRDTFDYPDLETHELLCNHLAPKLKGRPRRKRKKRSVSPGESSNESEASVASSAAASTSKGSSSSSGQSSLCNSTGTPGRPSAAVIAAAAAKRVDRKPSAEEKKFLGDVHTFMSSRNTPLGKMPLLGYRQIDLYLFYSKVQDLGGYDRVSENRLWKVIYDEMGGNTGSTSAATITRRHYERLLLPYERFEKGEDIKIKASLAGRRIKTPSISDASEDSVEVKRENESPPPSQTPPLSIDIPTSATITPPPMQSITSTSPFLPGDKPRSESGKTSSLRSVRVKPERLKSLNTIIATSNSTSVSQQQLPNSPTSLLSTSITTSSSTASSPTNTPPTSTTPTNGSVLERQLNNPVLSQQVPPSCSPLGLPVSAANATAVVTLTPPPEKDMKEIKLDPKQTNLLAQGKENIPLFEEKSPIFVDKPRSPEVIDLETDNEPGTRDNKLIIPIPSFKKRKLEILREGGLEVTPVELDARPSVIQPTTTVNTAVPALVNSAVPASTSPPLNAVPPIAGTASPIKLDLKAPTSPYSLPSPAVIPKLINVTVMPDIGHMLPRSEENRTPTKQQRLTPTSQNSNGAPPNQTPTANSRVINLGNSNASLLQLYANANVPIPQSLNTTLGQVNHRFVQPSLPNGRPLIPKVTQSRSIFGNSSCEKTVYGNPKDILAAPKYMPPMPPQPHTPRSPSMLSVPGVQCGTSTCNSEPPAGGILDLTAKPTNDRSGYGRPNLEIVRVPVVPRPTPLNLETRNFEAHHRSVINVPTNLSKDMNSSKPPDMSAQARNKSQFVTGSVPPNSVGYTNVLDNRTMATNNLEITLVSPKKSSGGVVGVPQLSPPTRNNTQPPPAVPVQRRPPPPSPQHHLNGKFPSRMPPEPISPYTPRKPTVSSGVPSVVSNHHPVIPNVPNLSHLNSSPVSSFAKAPMPNYQYSAMEKRKTTEATGSQHKEMRRISESDRMSMQQHLDRLESGSSSKQSRESESLRRHSVPSLPANYMPSIPPNSPAFLAHQLAAAGNSPSAAAAAAAAGKFLPILDPIYYPAFYNGLFPGPMAPPGAPAPPFLPPEFSAYYKELLALHPAAATAQQTRLAMAAGQQHQPAAPTSK
ncbi:AT-rich interactive domain-containing protein 5B-like [Phymastichus coffea]|uniref:AT-rich interactive domain-containing protein 5B-like n=1 Tax=Phymastichus coffea TaxID=108790 RepID=UPI00273A7653|nr:AT-rich interactive domain-containing protein 5B-like [Phymastichus coffea]